MTNLGSILKTRDISLPTKVCLVKAMVFPVVMYGCESWTVKKAEHRKIDVFELWLWRRLLRVSWTARRSKQFILKEISPWVFIGRTDVETETPILCPPHEKCWLVGKHPDAGSYWGQEEKGTTEDEMLRWLDGITDSMGMHLSELHELVMGRDIYIYVCICTYTHTHTHTHTHTRNSAMRLFKNFMILYGFSHLCWKKSKDINFCRVVIYWPYSENQYLKRSQERVIKCIKLHFNVQMPHNIFCILLLICLLLCMHGMFAYFMISGSL